MTQSILETIKKLLGLSFDYDAFDLDIIVHINSVISTLSQIGVNLQRTSIVDKTQTWNDVFGDITDIELLKSYIYIKVRLLFDPPTNSFSTEAYKKLADEYEWRITVQREVKEDSG